jgi:hypothetical protein
MYSVLTRVYCISHKFITAFLQDYPIIWFYMFVNKFSDHILSSGRNFWLFVIIENKQICSK